MKKLFGSVLILLILLATGYYFWSLERESSTATTSDAITPEVFTTLMADVFCLSSQNPGATLEKIEELATAAAMKRDIGKEDYDIFRQEVYEYYRKWSQGSRSSFAELERTQEQIMTKVAGLCPEPNDSNTDNDGPLAEFFSSLDYTPPKGYIYDHADIQVFETDEHFYGEIKSLNIAFDSTVNEDHITIVRFELRDQNKVFSIGYFNNGQAEYYKGRYLNTDEVATFDPDDRKLLLEFATLIGPTYRGFSTATMNFGNALNRLISVDYGIRLGAPIDETFTNYQNEYSGDPSELIKIPVNSDTTNPDLLVGSEDDLPPDFNYSDPPKE